MSHSACSPAASTFAATLCALNLDQKTSLSFEALQASACLTLYGSDWLMNLPIGNDLLRTPASQRA